MKLTKPMLALCGAMLATVLAVPAHAAEEGGSNIFTKDYIRSLSSLKMMDMMDGNKDHKVSKEEFMAYQSRLFDMMDRNTDGMIDKQEWERSGLGGKATG